MSSIISPLIACGGVWLIATGVWYSLGAFGATGFPGFFAYLGVCILGGTLCGRFL